MSSEQHVLHARRSSTCNVPGYAQRVEPALRKLAQRNRDVCTRTQPQDLLSCKPASLLAAESAGRSSYNAMSVL
jgi:hypothetical protein